MRFPFQAGPTAPQAAFSHFAKALFAAAIALATAHLSNATDLFDLDSNPTVLASHIQESTTLVFIVSDQEELSQAQRLLTQAFAADQHVIVLIELPDQTSKAALLRRAANRFFQSDFSRSRTFFLNETENPYPESKTILLAPSSSEPLFRSHSIMYPDSN